MNIHSSTKTRRQQQHLLPLLVTAMLVFPSAVNAFAPYAPSFTSRHAGLEIVIDLDNEDGTALKMAPSNETQSSRDNNSNNSTESSSDVAVLDNDEEEDSEDTKALDAEAELRKDNNSHRMEMKDGIQKAPRIHADLFRSIFEATEDSLNEYKLNTGDLEEQLEDFAVLQEREGETFTNNELYNFNALNIVNQEEHPLSDEGQSDEWRSAPLDPSLDSEEHHGALADHDQTENSNEFLDTYIGSIVGSDKYADENIEENDFNEDDSISMDEAAAKAVSAVSSSVGYKETETAHKIYQDDIENKEIELSVEEAAARAIRAALAAATASIEMAEEVIRVASMPIEVPEEANGNEANNIMEAFSSLTATTVNNDEEIRRTSSIGDDEEEMIDFDHVGHFSTIDIEKNTREMEETLDSFDSVFQDFSYQNTEEESLFEKTARNKAQFTVDDEITESLRTYMVEANATNTETKNDEQKCKSRECTEGVDPVPAVSLNSTAIAKELSKNDNDNSQDLKKDMSKNLFNVLDVELPHFEIPKINVPLMLEVHEHQVKKAMFVAKEGLSALGQGLAVIAKESIESGIEAVDKTNTTIVGNEDNMDYELALEKIERAGKGFAKLLGAFGGVVKDSVIFVADEINAKQEKQRHLAEAISVSVARQEASKRLVSATAIEPHKIRTTIEKDSAARFPDKMTAVAANQTMLPKSSKQYSTTIPSAPTNTGIRSFKTKGSSDQDALTSTTNTKKKHKISAATTENLFPVLSSDHVHEIKGKATVVLDDLIHSTSDVVNNAVVLAHQDAAIRGKQLDDIKANSKELFTSFFEEIGTEKPKRLLKAPKHTARDDLVKSATTKKGVIDSLPFYATRGTRAIK